MSLPVISVFFAVFWTLGMIWWEGASDPAHIAILVVAGALAGLLWFWLMGLWVRFLMRRRTRA